MIYQRPLAYLLGLEGVALLRGFAGERGQDFTEARIAEIRRLLDDSAVAIDGVTAARADTVAGYRVWSATYDEPGNGLFPPEETVVREIIETLPVGTALDAACGTGRHTAWLADRGHRVIGVDSSPEMLARAHDRAPTAEFRPGDLCDLPLPDNHVDLVVCALALTHLPDLRPVIAEFARVLRPGGHLVISDVHQELIALGSVPRLRFASGEPGMLPAYRHRASDYLTAALPLGLQVRRCAEPGARATGDPVRDPGDGDPAGPIPDGAIGGWDDWPWSLFDLVPAASRAAYDGMPVLVVWHFQLATGNA
nr:class I SAM-dependent methyltransferase [Micromonospora sp. DSM 115978]